MSASQKKKMGEKNTTAEEGVERRKSKKRILNQGQHYIYSEERGTETCRKESQIKTGGGERRSISSPRLVIKFQERGKKLAKTRSSPSPEGEVDILTPKKRKVGE